MPDPSTRGLKRAPSDVSLFTVKKVKAKRTLRLVERSYFLVHSGIACPMLRMIFLMLVCNKPTVRCLAFECARFNIFTVAASFITGGEGMTIFSVLNPRRFWVKVKGFAAQKNKPVCIAGTATEGHNAEYCRYLRFGCQRKTRPPRQPENT